ncbi:nucleoside triphosphate pyrophosphatase [Micrococcus sp.]|uniref:Maf family protein n=1 Tax=Micrococcus sp. TaxID=1271 RepID=UPI002A91E8D0|nr:nucleoside triphosphate pyrophosphatase [Micrococcus sp.]MDY6054834.1 nucleoside triphosphate pyrophosphatase [Micrococcus sp.]
MSTPAHDDGAGTPGAGLTLVLGSASAGRADVLRRALLPFRVVVSEVDEQALGRAHPGACPARLAELLAEAKGRDVAARVAAQGVGVPTLVVGCDSVFELDGTAYGKPHEPEVAVERWRRQSGRTGLLHTGQWAGLVLPGEDGAAVESLELVSAAVRFAEVDEATVRAYVATGEPLGCAGAFTVDGAGAALVEGVDGDPNAVIGLSVSRLRAQGEALGVRLVDLWGSSNPTG